MMKDREKNGGLIMKKRLSERKKNLIISVIVALVFFILANFLITAAINIENDVKKGDLVPCYDTNKNLFVDEFCVAETDMVSDLSKREAKDTYTFTGSISFFLGSLIIFSVIVSILLDGVNDK